MSSKWKRLYLSPRKVITVVTFLCVASVIIHRAIFVSRKKDWGHVSDATKQDIYVRLKTLDNRLAKLENVKKNRHKDVQYRMYSEQKRILVTGGAGFIGSHLVDKLMLDGHQVIVVDNFLTGNKRNIEPWIDHENFELIDHDITKPLNIEVDQIYHLGSPASANQHVSNPMATVKANVIGTINMLGLAKRVQARLLFASSSEVYGDPRITPQTEDYWGHVNTQGETACYSESKRIAETTCYAYERIEDVEVRVARIFNTYGPRMPLNDGRAVTSFILSALLGEKLTVYGDGSQITTFLFVEDLVDGLILLMNSNFSQPVNFGSQDSFSVLEFAKLVVGSVRSKSDVVAVRPKGGRFISRVPDITRAKKILNWRPNYEFERGINATVDYIRDQLQISTVNVKNSL